jgi:hypothetical protein
MNLIATLRHPYGQVEVGEITVSEQQLRDFSNSDLAPHCCITTRREKAWEAVIRANWSKLWPCIRNFAAVTEDFWYMGTCGVRLSVAIPGAEREEIFDFSATESGIPEFTHIVFELSADIAIIELLAMFPVALLAVVVFYRREFAELKAQPRAFAV